MQTVSAQLTAACAAAGQRPCFYLEISWTGAGAILGARGAAGWTDETAYLRNFEISMGVNPPGERLVAAGSINTARIALDNSAGRFYWENAAGPLYSYIGGAAGMTGKPVRLWAGYITTNGSEYVCVFTGVIGDEWNYEAGALSLDCRDWGWRYLQHKRSTVVVTDQRPDTWIRTVASDAGMALSEMVLDVGIFAIRFAWMDDESVVDEIWDAAEADAGLAFFDQRGRLCFQNTLHWLSLPVVWAFDEGSYVLANPTVDARSLATEILVEYSGRYIAGMVPLYELEQYKSIMPGATETWTARFRYAAYAVYDPISAEPYEDYYALSLGGTDMTDKITVTLSEIFGQQATVTVENTSVVSSAQLVNFRIRGLPLIGGPTEQAKAQASPAPLPFDRTRSERGNPYVQTAEQAQAHADLLALRCRRVRSLWPLRNVPAVPQLELTDLVQFTDNRALGSGTVVEGIVMTIKLRGGPGVGLYQDIGILDVAGMAEYDDYFFVGIDTLGANARAYY